MNRRVLSAILGSLLLASTLAHASERCRVLTGINVVPLPVQPDYSGNQMSAHFTVSATFDDTAPFACGCCEYRQYFRAATGKFPFMRDGNPTDVQVVDPTNPANRINVNDHPQDFVEDYRNYGFGKIRAGHRGEAKGYPLEYYRDAAGNEDRANGCSYEIEDAPWMTNLMPGHSYEINLVFRAEIICVKPECGPGGSPHRQKDWNVALQKVQP